MMNPKSFKPWILIAAILLQHYAYAAEEEQRTRIQVGDNLYNGTNGNAWKKLDMQAKITFLLGAEEGLVMMQLQMQTEKRSNKSIMDAQASGSSLMINGFRYSDMVSQVDSFYSDTANLRVPIIEVHRFVLRKLKGATPLELENSAATLRRIYNQ